MSELEEKGQWKAHWTINKFFDPMDDISRMAKNGAPISVLKEMLGYMGHEEIDGNLLLNTGIDEIWNLIVGDSANTFDNANAQIGVGSDNTAAAAGQTDLIGGSTAYKGMDVAYPLTTSQAATFRATFASGDGNFSWQEFVIKQSVSSICLNRRVIDKGTKVVGETWIVALTITLS